jgi:cyclophilin family peptidyl-prolyl cis-trans isomerase
MLIFILMATAALSLALGGIFSTKAWAQDGPQALARPIAVFDTSMGTFEVELYTDLAPITTGNFIKLVNDKYYDGTIFHRVIDDFMIQGGDPTGTGTGGPGYSIKDEFGLGLAHNEAGILSMANAGKDTGGSQFFITLVPTPWLDGKHAIFGHVISGLDVVKAIGKEPVGPRDKPNKNITINSITIKDPPQADGASSPDSGDAGN